MAVAMPAAAFVVVVRVLLLLKSIRRRAAAHTVRVHRTAGALIHSSNGPVTKMLAGPTG